MRGGYSKALGDCMSVLSGSGERNSEGGDPLEAPAVLTYPVSASCGWAFSNSGGVPLVQRIFLISLSLLLLTAMGTESPETEYFRDLAELEKKFEAEKGGSALERLPTIQAIGALGSEESRRFLARILTDRSEKTSVHESVLRVLAPIGDKISVEAVVLHGFRVIPENSWWVIRDCWKNGVQEDGHLWLGENVDRVLPALDARAQGMILTLMKSGDDPSLGAVAARMIGHRKIPPQNQGLLVDLIRRHNVQAALKKVAKLFRVNHSGLQRSVLKALQAMGGDEHSRVFTKALKNRNWEVRVVAADIFGETHDPDVVSLLVPLLEDPFMEVQVAVVQALQKIGGKGVIEPLIDALEGSTGRVRDDIADALLWLTGKDLGVNRASWGGWWTANRDSAEVRGITREEYDRARAEASKGLTGNYYGLRVISQFVTFVVDTSGSMQEPYLVRSSRDDRGAGERPGGTGVGPGRDGKDGKAEKHETLQKIEVAQRELARVLRQLRNGTQFNLVPFDSQYHLWRPALVEMDDEIREDALAFVEALTPGGMTNIYDTLMTTLKDPEVNTLYFLSDGAPTMGEIVDPDAILEKVRELNEIRKIKIHTIGFHLDPVATVLMRRLAEENYGTFVER